MFKSFHVKSQSVFVQCALIIFLLAPSSIATTTAILTKIYVDDLSGGLENSPNSPIAPLLDSNYMDQSLFLFLDSSGCDSVVQANPEYDPADSLYTRPDGSIAKLADLSTSFYLYFSADVSWPEFGDEYLSLQSQSLVSPEYVTEFNYVPSDLFIANQPYMFPIDSGAPHAVNATSA